MKVVDPFSNNPLPHDTHVFGFCFFIGNAEILSLFINIPLTWNVLLYSFTVSFFSKASNENEVIDLNIRYWNIEPAIRFIW